MQEMKPEMYDSCSSDMAADPERLLDLQCPRCGEMNLRPIKVENALSRRDNKTWICSACGNQEAFVDMGWEQEKVWFKPL